MIFGGKEEYERGVACLSWARFDTTTTAPCNQSPEHHHATTSEAPIDAQVCSCFSAKPENSV